eukprot:TRINITY_DN783_c0_g1_i1.p1 TRINITY_DN783_c0_g1~~TRINITY_DN783_c0_g1_i1.p1  ORF type:complete len:118 (-),score=32.67 TRINITY_DN783_c0_g1_i1:101-454(-)
MVNALLLNDSSCQATVEFSGREACPASAPAPTPSPSPSPSPSEGLSGGWVFVILLLVFSMTYIIGGCAYMRIKYGVTGMEAFPNVEFWRSLCDNAAAGCRYMADCILCRRNDQYRSI